MEEEGLKSKLAAQSEADFSLSTFAHDSEQAKHYGRAARAPRTRHEYARDWADFERYCINAHQCACPAEPTTVAAYLASLGDRLTPSTIRRRAAAISSRHRDAGFTSPTAHQAVELILAGIARTHGRAPRRKAALTIELLREALEPMNDGSLRSLRDRALLLIGFAAALRRSEIVALNVADIEYADRGITLHIRHSKTDQEQHGEMIAIPIAGDEALCPVQALSAWLEAAQITEGPVFRSFALPRGRARSEIVQAKRLTGQDVARTLQRALDTAGISGDFSGHSLRAGFITSAAVRGVSEASIQRVSRHRSTAVLRGYVRHATRFDDAPFADILQKRSVRR